MSSPDLAEKRFAAFRADWPWVVPTVSFIVAAFVGYIFIEDFGLMGSLVVVVALVGAYVLDLTGTILVAALVVVLYQLLASPLRDLSGIWWTGPGHTRFFSELAQLRPLVQIILLFFLSLPIVLLKRAVADTLRAGAKMHTISNTERTETHTKTISR